MNLYLLLESSCTTTLGFNNIYSILTTIFVGVVSGIVASIVYAIMKRVLYPKIKIVPFAICNYNKETGKRYIAVKVINKTRVRLTDVSISMDFLDYNKADGNYDVRGLERTRKFNPLMDRFVNDRNIQNPPASYALVTGFVLDFDPLEQPDAEDKFFFTIKATHPISGTSICKTKEFKCNDNDIRKNSAYNSGDNVSCHAIKEK